jgi:thiamine-phosphate diphosphorylase
MTKPGSLRPMLPLPVLMLVTDRSLTGGVDGLTAAVVAAVEGGVNLVQVREGDLPEDEQLELASSLVQAVGQSALVVLNGSAALARKAGAHGAHLAERSGVAQAERRAAQLAGLISGQSVHSLEAARDAAAAGADYLVLGTIFPSRSHPGGATGGLERVAEVAGAVPLPVIGIGGITAENAADVMRAGASGIAVISAILAVSEPRLAAARLRAALGESTRGRPRGPVPDNVGTT